MAVIDKGMYDNLKKWYDRKRPANQFMIYVNSNDRVLTSATIRKLMFEISKEDIHGEEYVAFYSVENYLRNMRDYYKHISDLYRHKTGEGASVEDIIADLPPTCGWITLIVEDIDALSADPGKMQKVFRTFVKFAAKRANVIVIGNGDYKDVFSGCEYALGEMAAGLEDKVENNLLMIGCYDQETIPNTESIVFDSESDQRDELEFYWITVYEQLKEKLFDYVDFKTLYKDTLEYIIPRVSKEQVYRKDLRLIEKIGTIRHINDKNIDGCDPWEFDSAKKLAVGLHEAIINTFDDNDDFLAGEIDVDVDIEERAEDFGGIHISGYTGTTVKVGVDTVSREMDNLAKRIHECTYLGNAEFGFLTDGIKEIADKTINKDPGNKVLRYKGNSAGEETQMSEDGKKSGGRILNRDYDIPAEQIKGYEKLEREQTRNVDDCKLTRFIAVLDDTGYTINADGNPEMTLAAQNEYDEFVSKIRQSLMKEGIKVIDEGYGIGEDELEWHITGCFINPEDNNDIVSIMEIDTCVRTEE